MLCQSQVDNLISYFTQHICIFQYHYLPLKAIRWLIDRVIDSFSTANQYNEPKVNWNWNSALRMVTVNQRVREFMIKMLMSISSDTSTYSTYMKSKHSIKIN